MGKLRFEYNLFNVPGSIYPSEETKIAFEAKETNKYAAWIDRINYENGYINVNSADRDGMNLKGDLAASAELLDEITNHL
jgi:hypothetical protein